MDRIDPFTPKTTIATITSTGMIVVIAKVNVEVWSMGILGGCWAGSFRSAVPASGHWFVDRIGGVCND